MKSNIFLFLLAAASVFGLNAAVETEELMIVTLKDGSVVEYNVNNVEKVAFDIRENVVALAVTPAGGETQKFSSIPVLFRQSPSETGGATIFGLGTVDAESPADLVAGEYGVCFSLSAATLYTPDLDLAENKDSYTLKLIKYENGELDYVLDEVESGSLTTAVDNKTRKVTVALNAKFTDGTEIMVDYCGAATAAETVEDMIPAVKYGNEFYYYNASGDLAIYSEISGVTHKVSAYSGKHTFTFTPVSDSVFDVIKFEVEGDAFDTIFDGEEHAMAETAGWSFRYSSFQLDGYSESWQSDYKNHADNGTMRCKKNEDGTYEIFFDVQNYYDNFSGKHNGTPEKILINYVGTVE